MGIFVWLIRVFYVSFGLFVSCIFIANPIISFSGLHGEYSIEHDMHLVMFSLFC